MSLQRLLAATPCGAMRQVRCERGDEAVILSLPKEAGERCEVLAAAAAAVQAVVAASRRPRAAAPTAPRKPGGADRLRDFLKLLWVVPKSVMSAQFASARCGAG